MQDELKTFQDSCVSWVRHNLLEKVRALFHNVTRAFRPRIYRVTCVSRSSCNKVVRAGELLGSAEGMQVVFMVRWPILWAKRAQRVEVELAVESREDSQSGGRGVNGGIPGSQCKVKQARLGRTSRVRVQLPASTLRHCAVLHLEILEKHSRQTLRHLQVRVLSPQETQNQVVRNLRADSVCLWIEGGGRFYPGDQVPASSHGLVAELRIAGCALAAFAPPIAEVLAWRLSSEKEAITFEQQKIIPQAGPQVVRSPKISLQDEHLIPGPGNYAIAIKIADRDLASVRFRVLAESEVLRQVRVSHIRIDAEKRDGQVVPGLSTLRWEEHRSFRLILKIETGVPAPSNLARLIVRVMRGATVLWREDFLQPLDRAIRHIKLQSLDLHTLGLRAEPRPARLSVSVCLCGEVQCSAPILVLPPERITNFEGQLNFDAQDLPLDEMEYGQIVQRLGLESEPAPLGTFGKWWEKLRFRSATRPAHIATNER